MIAIYGLGLKLFPRGGNEVEIMLMGWWLLLLLLFPSNWKTTRSACKLEL
jgi:hypothetical protein